MNDRRTAVALFVLAFGAYCYFYGGWGANQEVNYALTRAVVEAHTFQVDEFTVHEGDIAAGRDGHIYSNKAPGFSMFGVLPYSVQYALQQRGVFTLRDYWRTNKQLVTIAICGVPGALIPAILFLYGRRTLRVSAVSAATVAILIAFGTIVLVYSTLMFAHVASAFFLLLAFTLVRTRPLLAGMAAGMAGACFLLSAVAGFVLVALALWHSRRSAALLVAGAVPFAAALALYQWICFGSPFATPVERSIDFTRQDLILGVFGRPHLDRLWDVTFSEYRGLFFYSPALLFGIAGAVLMVRRRAFLPELAAIGAIVSAFLFANASFNGWHGGAAFGPRYLVTMIPLVGIPMMMAAERLRWLWWTLGAISIAVLLLVTAVDPMPIDGLRHPFTAHILPTFLARPVSAEARSILYPDCTTARCTDKQVSIAPEAGNLGEAFLGRGHWRSILPMVLWIYGGSAAVLASARRQDRLRAGTSV
jgi:hypothetical protein